jgi:hypothetical protein
MTLQGNAAIPPIIYKRPQWSFYAAWILLTSLCVPVAFFLDIIILRFITNIVGDFIYVNGVRHITEDYLAIYPLVLFVGLLTGEAQYGLLRRTLPRMGWWVPATVGGWLLGLLVAIIPGWLHLEKAFNLDLVFILIGLSIGAAQWLLLRERLPRAGWWIAANALGWGLLALVTQGNSIDQYGLFILGLLPACATAATLALLMKQVPGGVNSTG